MQRIRYVILAATSIFLGCSEPVTPKVNGANAVRPVRMMSIDDSDLGPDVVVGSDGINAWAEMPLEKRKLMRQRIAEKGGTPQQSLGGIALTEKLPGHALAIVIRDPRADPQTLFVFEASNFSDAAILTASMAAVADQHAHPLITGRRILRIQNQGIIDDAGDVTPIDPQFLELTSMSRAAAIRKAAVRETSSKIPGIGSVLLLQFE